MLSLIALIGLVQSGVDRVPLEGNPLFNDLGQYWKDQMPVYGVTGFTIAAIKDGKVVLLDGVGVADPLSGKAADIDTRYYIASITKTMTGVAIAQLAEQGKVDLDAPVQKYLPRFTLADADYAKSVTIRDLLSHRKGIKDSGVTQLDAYTGEVTEDRYYTMLGRVMPTKEVGYSNIDFTLLGRVIESVTGKSWKDYLSENVFAPIGMNRTTAYLAPCLSDANLAAPIVIGRSGPEPSQVMKTDRTMHAAGGVMSTTRDLTKYALGFLNGGVSEDRRFLKESSVADAFAHQSTTPQSGSIRKLSGYGYAWSVGDYRDIKGFVAHSGGYTGYNAYIAMVPSKGVGIVVLTNTGGSGEGFCTVIAVDMLDRLLGYPIDEGVRKAYSTQVQEVMAKQKDLKPIGPNPAVSGMLSAMPSQYVGTFSNSLYGDIVVSLSGGNLRMDWGDLPILLKSTVMDEFTGHQDITDLRGVRGKFLVSNGKCQAVELQMAQAVRFDRK